MTFAGFFLPITFTRSCQIASPSVQSAKSTATTTTNTSSPSEQSAEVDWFVFVLGLGVRITVTYFLGRQISKILDRTMKSIDNDVSVSSRRLEVLLKKRNPDAILPQLTEHEIGLAQDIVDPDDMEVSFADIGGIDHIKQQVWELAILPLKDPSLFSESKLTQSPKGILLYGKPGTGKTMLAKAIAKEAGAMFIALKLSKIMDKWVGESQKWVAAAFGLARKVAPSIIFIDELDTFLNPRGSSSELDGTGSLKSEFLTLWDGITTNDNGGVLVLGATNRPHHVDSAILRRLPRMFEVPMPNRKSRLDILNLILKTENLSDDAREFIPQLAMDTEGYSGSDLKELCRAAAFERIREASADVSRRAVMGDSNVSLSSPPSPEKESSDSTLSSSEDKDNLPSEEEESRTSKRKLRPISVEDFLHARETVRATGVDAFDYGKRLYEETKHWR